MEKFYENNSIKLPLALMVITSVFSGVFIHSEAMIVAFFVGIFANFAVWGLIKENSKSGIMPIKRGMILYIIANATVFFTFFLAIGKNGNLDVFWYLGTWLIIYILAVGLTAKIFGFVESSLNNYDDSSITSFLNPRSVIRGFKWSNFNEIKTDLNDGVYIDNFQLVENGERFGKEKRFEIENIDLKIKALDFTKTILAIGKAGSGKTEFFLNLVSQNTDFKHFKRELYHDVKGDFVQKLYNKKTDYILNPFDSRGLVWDMWKDMQHNEALVVSFIQNLLVSQVKESDFWTTSASKLLSDSIMRVHFTFGAKLTSAEKWDKLLEVLEDYKNNINDDKTKQSIWQTLELGLEYVNLLAFQTKKAKKLFSIYEWCSEQNSRLFLLNNASYSKKLNPYFTGFLACVIEVLLSKGDTKTDLTLLLLDEYLSLKLDESVRLKLMTQIRSKGGCCVLGVQYLDANDKKQKQLIGSSTFAKILFNVADDETVDTFVRAYGTVEWEKKKTSTSTTRGAKKDSNSTSTSTSIEDKNQNFITHEIIKSLSSFRHITFIDEKSIYYVGYTKQANLLSLNYHFEKRDMGNFYEWLYNRDNKGNTNINNEVLEIENIDETQKYLIKPFEERLSIYTDLKECIESNDTDLMDKVIKKWKLENVDVEKFIDDFEA